MSKIGFSGYYGMSNYGDDLFAIAAFLGAQKYWSQHEPRLLCEPISGLDVRYSIFPLIPKGGLASCDARGKFLRLTNLMWGAITLNKFVFAGGSLFSSSSSGGMNALIYLKRMRRDYFSAIGVSIGPFADSKTEKIVMDRLRGFEYIAVRDSISYERLMSYNMPSKIVQAADLVGVLPELLPFSPASMVSNCTPGSNESETLQIGFSPCFLAASDHKAQYYCDQFVSFAHCFSKEKCLNVDVICLNQHPVVGDLNLCNYVINSLASKGIDCSLRLYQKQGALATWRRISELDAYYSVRLHGAITAYLSGIPFFLFEYHEKCTKFLDFIGKPADQRVESSQPIGADMSAILRNVLTSSLQSGLSVSEFSSLSEKNFTCAPFSYEA